MTIATVHYTNLLIIFRHQPRKAWFGGVLWGYWIRNGSDGNEDTNEVDAYYINGRRALPAALRVTLNFQHFSLQITGRQPFVIDLQTLSRLEYLDITDPPAELVSSDNAQIIQETFDASPLCSASAFHPGHFGSRSHGLIATQIVRIGGGGRIE